ncbi:hypothetical protein BH24PSE2_BH24PSE2_05870 [soil metagenome]
MVETDGPFPDLVSSLAGLAHGTVVAGNAVEIVENGTFFDRLLTDIEAAKQSIHFETYLWKKGAVE